MRILVVLALLIALLGPSIATASPAECSRLERQLQHFQGMLERAKERDSELWEDRMNLHIARLVNRFEERCPELAAKDDTAQMLAALLKAAGSAALTFFTMGAF
jgi:hypothetical protein